MKIWFVGLAVAATIAGVSSIGVLNAQVAPNTNAGVTNLTAAAQAPGAPTGTGQLLARGGGGGGGGGMGGMGGGGMGGMGGGGMGGGGMGGGGMGGGGMGGGMGGMGGGMGGMGGGRTVVTLQSYLSAPDDEWAVLQPRIQRVTDAETELAITYQTVGRTRAGTAAPAPTLQPTITSTLTDLVAAIVAEPPTTDDILKVKLQAYRDARQRAQDALTKAHDDLRMVVTMRQEAILMSLGYLD